MDGIKVKIFDIKSKSNLKEIISKLIECFKKLPGVGEKTAERLALFVLEMDDSVAQLFSSSILNVTPEYKINSSLERYLIFR